MLIMVRCHKLLLISVMLLVIGNVQGRVCVGLRELTFHKTPKRNFGNADNHCISLGGRLVKVDNAEVTTAITGAIQRDAYYYTGAKRDRDGSRFFWRDRSNVPLPAESGYSNWQTREPNEANQHCVLLRNSKWVDDSCAVDRFFICQKEFGITASLTPDSIRVTRKGKYSTTCTATATGCGTPTVTWHRSQRAVSKIATRNVYQSGGSGSATLWLQNLWILPGNSGPYECRAAVGDKHSQWYRFTVTVAGFPILSSLTAQPCTTNLMVHWTANSLSKGLPHRLKVFPDSRPGMVQSKFVNENEISIIRNLLPSTLYNVEIFTCTSQSDCKTGYKAKRSEITRGLPNSARGVNIGHRHGRCRLTWQEPEVVGDQITGYQVKITEEFFASRTNETEKSHVFNVTEKSYIFDPLPNRRYSASVKSLACAGASIPIVSTGLCIGSSQAPTEVATPTVDITTGGDLNIKVQVPSEENGIISCLLVIITNETRAGNETGNHTEYTFEQLSTMANTSKKQMTAYIAVAIPASSFALKKEVGVTVGDASNSSCNLHNTSLENAADGISVDALDTAIIVGHNKPLNGSEQRWVYVVAAVPNRTRILFKRSAQVVFSRPTDRPYTTSATNTNSNDASPTPPGKTEPQSLAATVGAICGVVILILLSVVSFVIYKWRRDPKRATSSNLSNTRSPTNREGENPNVGWHQEDGDGVDIHDNRDGNYAYANYAPGLHNETSFRVCDIEKVYDTKRSKNNAVFLDEFKKIVQDSAQIEGTKEVASSDHLKPKNRYKNILPYDANRVVLETGDSGYINASYIRGGSQTDKYVATQGPLAATVNDFWLMIFEQNSCIIVMLTKGCEAGKKKCESYWPESQMHRTYGCVTVQNIQEINHGAYICRTFSMSFAAGGDNAEARSVRHYQFLKWPDHGVPQTTSNLVRMHRDIAQDYAGSPSSGPMIVHCSAGAGRTGTFIGYDILLDEMRVKSRIDVSKCVMDMRKQRVDMVQNSEQYVLLHKLVLECYLFDETDCSPEEAKNKFEEMNRPGGNAVVLKEFEDLDKVEPIKNTKNIGMLEENEAFNRPGNELPFDYSNVTIMMRENEERAPYLNASCVESYDDGYRMIAAQGLTDASIEVFWRAVVSNGVRTIVMLTNLVENNKEQCVQYWPSAPGEKLVLGDISVTLVSHEAHGTIVERNFSVEQATKRRALQVTQLHYIDWQQGSNPGNERDVIDLIARMQEILRQTTKAAALIHCSDRTGRTGTFCAIVNLIDRLKCENRIDVFRTVKDLRDGRPNMVKTLDQYKYCYQAIVHYLKSFELYANF